MSKRTILVTGASTGIGRACALRLARRGHRVLASVRKAEDARRLETEADGELSAVRFDVADVAEVRLAAEEIGDVALAGLVNNAGVAGAGPLESIPLEEFRRTIEINLIGQLSVIQTFLPNVRAGRGRIVNVTSIGGRVVSPFMGGYVAAKFGFEALTDALRMELLPWGIDVIAVEPGSIDTEIWDKGEDHLAQTTEAIGERGRELYADQLESMRETLVSVGKRGAKPDRVARVIEKALTARRPKPRYLVGLDARGMLAMRKLLPTRLVDRLYVRGMGLASELED